MTGFTLAEPTRETGVDSPQHGELWEVVRLDNIGTHMRKVVDRSAYTESVRKKPCFGETWWVLAQNPRRRLWMNKETDDLYEQLRHTQGESDIEEGKSYTLMSNLSNKRGWVRRDTGTRHWEICQVGYESQLVYKVYLWGKPFEALVDSGAQGNYMATRTAKRLRITGHRKEEPYPLVLATGAATNGVTMETGEIRMDIGEHEENIDFDIAPLGTHEVILGMSWIRKHNPTINWETGQITLDKCKCPSNAYRTRKTLCVIAKESGYQAQDPPLSQIPVIYQEYADLFKEEKDTKALPKEQPWDHVIPLVEGKTPPYQAIYAMAERELQVLRKYLDENLAKGFIRPSTSPAGAPTIFVPKKGLDKDGKPALRFCVDYRKLNEITIKDRYALPLANELKDRLQGAKWFTKLDLRGAYNLIRIRTGEEWKTAFRTRYGHFEYLVMPFGLTNAPATCMRLMNDILREFLDVFVIAYLDDILVFSKEEQEHIGHVRKVLTALRKGGMLLKEEKCEFHTKKVEFLGHIITPEGIGMDPAKVSSILE